MRAEVKILSLSYLMLLSFMIMTALFDGILSTIVYYLGYFVAIIVGMILYSVERKVKIFSLDFLKIDKRGCAITALSLAPTVALIMGVSYLTTLLLSATTGAMQSVELDGRIWVDILVHAIIPAILEEALFRYLPFRVLSGGSKWRVVVFSSIFFACIHTSFFSIPYAFVAGAVFMTVDILSDSVIPSLILHFCNNLLSVTWLYFADNSVFCKSYLTVLLTLAFLSVVVMAVFCRGELKKLASVMREGEKLVLSYEPLLFIVPTVVLAVYELI